MTVQLNLDGLALQTNPDYDYLPSPEDDSLPEVHPYDHQVETYETVLNNDAFFIQNTSPTGGGKTYSWVAPAVEEGLNVIVMYPTNALIIDQYQTVKTFLDNYRTDVDVETLLFTGPKLAEMRKQAPEANISNADVIDRDIKRAFKKHDATIMFTNPDVFTLLRHGQYGPEARRQTDRFDMVVFDEFHRADTKGQNSILFFMDDMYHEADTSKFMLLSATLDGQVATKLDTAFDMPSHTITCDGGRAPLSQVVNDDGEIEDGWRSIMPAIDIEFREGSPFQTADDILSEENLYETTQFCQQGRTVMMLDGLREVRNAHSTLREELPDKDVYRIDGMTRGDIDSKLESFDVLTSNSAVEVGIDFVTDQVVFSGYSTDSFLQRIGRLRSHSGGMETKKAISYVRRDTVEQMAKVAKTGGLHGGRIPRDRFERVIRHSSRKDKEPVLFTPMYTALEFFNYIHDRSQDLTTDDRVDYLKEAHDRIKRHCFDPLGYEMNKERIDELVTLSHSPLVDNTLKQYRGSNITTLMYDTREETLKTYSLNHILSHGDVRFHSRDDFIGEVLARSPAADGELHNEIQRKEKHTVGYCTYNGYRTFPENTPEDDKTGRAVRFIPSAKLRNHLQKPPGDPERRPVVTSGLQVDVEDDFGDVPGLAHLNADLQDEKITCYAVEGSSHSVKMEYNLNEFFFLSELTNTRGDYTLATGLNALYLHCHDRKRHGLLPLIEDDTEDAISAAD